MGWYLMVWKKYAQFNGRSQRREYWMFTLLNSLICILLFAPAFELQMRRVGQIFFGLYFVYLLAVLVPLFTVSVRRLHDTGRSGWWLLLIFVPIVSLALIFPMMIEGDPSPNKYGPNPKLFKQTAQLI